MCHHARLQGYKCWVALGREDCLYSSMIYLSGHICHDLQHPMLGFMNTPRMNQTLPKNVFWAADNGRFSAPEKYTDHGFLSWLWRQQFNKKLCLFAVAPDVLADYEATLMLSRPIFPLIRAAGYKPAFVAQDGWNEKTVPWREFDVLFLGGTDKFKLGSVAREAAQQAKRY